MSSHKRPGVEMTSQGEAKRTLMEHVSLWRRVNVVMTSEHSFQNFEGY